MKTLITTAIAGFLMISTGYAQTNQEQMTSIDIKRTAIDNNISSYQKVEKHRDGTTSKCVFKDGNDLKMVAIEVTENNIDKKVELYFANGELIYATQLGIDITTGYVVDNESTYVNNNQAITWIKTGNISVNSSSRQFKAMNTELMAYAGQLEKDSAR